MAPRRVITVLTSTILGLALLVPIAGPAGATSQTSLLLPSSTAFSILGRSCGGIQQQAFATGFATDGFPTGAVYLQTRCGGSGRGGGYHVKTYSAWAMASWDFTGVVRSSVVVSTPPTVSATFTATDAFGDTLTNVLTAINVAPAACSVGNTTYCTYRAYLAVPPPGTPTAVGVAQSGDALIVTWSASASGGVPASYTVTATPTVGTTLTASVAGTGTSVSIPGVAPSTTYSITATATNAAGTSLASAPITITTGAASVVPGAPTGVTAAWGTNGTSILVHWTAPPSGDSPIDDYQVSIARYDPNGPPTVIDAGLGTSLTATGFDSIPDWAVQVRAHNAAGWGLWSKRVVLGGL